MDGFIQLHKKICEWEWYTDIPTKTLFLHILLKCNYKEAKWRGKVIKPGQFITSSEHLAMETGLTRQQVRTALKKLESTGEITYQATNDYTMLGLNNWATYNQPDNQRITNDQPTNNQRITTTNKEYKEYKENNTGTDTIVSSQAIVPLDNRNKEINDLLEVIKGQVEFLGFIYKKGKYERERAKNILTGKDFGAVCERARMSRVEFCKNIIYTSTLLTFWNGKINNAETLYEHYAKVYNDAVNKKSEMERPKSALDITL